MKKYPKKVNEIIAFLRKHPKVEALEVVKGKPGENNFIKGQECIIKTKLAPEMHATAKTKGVKGWRLDIRHKIKD